MKETIHLEILCEEECLRIVEPFHLDRYLSEQVFPYNNRATKDNKITDADRFVLLMTQVAGKRLTHAELTGKESLRSEQQAIGER